MFLAYRGPDSAQFLAMVCNFGVEEFFLVARAHLF
jgi:hypothetical protein